MWEISQSRYKIQIHIMNNINFLTFTVINIRLILVKMLLRDKNV